MRSDDSNGIDGGPIETLDDAAIAINARVIQGQIKAVDQEGQRLLDRLAVLVEREESAARRLAHDHEKLHENRESNDRLAKESFFRQMRGRSH